MDIQRKAITVLVVMLAFLAFVPAGCSGLSNGNSGTSIDETEITLNTSSTPATPGPGTIWVTGWVIDPEGQPVPNASISFERMWENPPGIATTKSLADGSYKMKKTWGYFQKITVQKEGYQTFVRGAIFKIYNNELNLTLTPKGTSVPGFNFEVAISAILIGLLLVDVRKSR